MHSTEHPLAGQTITLTGHPDRADAGPTEFTVDDWWDRLTGRSWMISDRNPAAMKYGIRTGLGLSLHGDRIPTDEEVVYGHTADGLGHLIHSSELDACVSEVAA